MPPNISGVGGLTFPEIKSLRQADRGRGKAPAKGGLFAMEYKLDDDRQGFHVWLSAAEFEKVKGDASRCAVPLDEYIGEIALWGISEAVKMGLQPREGEKHLVVTGKRRT
jgi:hypothetical protein